MGGAHGVTRDAEPSRAPDAPRARTVAAAALALALVAAPFPSRAAEPETPVPVVEQVDDPDGPARERAPEPSGPSGLPLSVDRSWVAIRLGLGTVWDARLDVFVTPRGPVRLALEAVNGGILFWRAYGGGARVQLETVRGERDTMVVSPGVVVLTLPPDHTGFFGHQGTLQAAVADAEIAWLHRFDYAEYELGFRIGAVIGEDTDGGNYLFPQLAFFTGVRF